ncbi:MAG: Smr domain protein [Lentisphaerae bacterium ADurb.BinA184]|nr:MAG: Smr domain protein [Lentisphaerae bacterium ADurb.BinA184]
MAKIKVDLHDVFNQGRRIDEALASALDEAVRRRVPLIEIIPGKGSGQLKKHVVRFLADPAVRRLYHRVEKDSHNWGRLFVHLRF